MRAITVVLLSVSLALVACKDNSTTCIPVATPKASATAPTDILDLSHWYLTLPVDANGARSGAAHTVLTSELLSGYSSDWFHGSEDNGVTFFAPVQGATTAHTPYPRSELREVLDPANYATNWAASSIAELSAYLAVHQVPSANGKVTVGEIVGYNNDNPDVTVLSKLVYEYNAGECLGTLYASTLSSPTASGSTASRQVLTRSIQLGEAFPYTIHVENHAIHIANGANAIDEPIGPDWDSVGLYFRAGAGLFASGDDPAEGARVTFYQLQATH